MQTDDDLETLVKHQDHLNVLRFIRVHELREPALVLSHGKALLGGAQLSKSGGTDGLSRLAALEQICLAALDAGESDTAETCLAQIVQGGVAKDAVRFRRLLARCLEAAGDVSGADLIYQALLKENPANGMARQRLYCLARAQVGKETEAAAALNTHLEHNPADTAAWLEMAQLRLELGDYKAASYCYEEIILEAPADPTMQCRLAECYASLGNATTRTHKMEYLKLARQHFAQALELDATSLRAQWGLLTAANACLVQVATASKKEAPVDDHDQQVAEALVKFAADKLLQSYKGTPMFPTVKKTVQEYTS
jgi:tetratricopeptide (TPR) repeat protein